VSRSRSTRLIQIAMLIFSMAIMIQTAFAQSTPPPRPTPTQSGGEATPVRNTPTPASTPIGEGTPFRPTPTSPSEPPPSRATPTLSSPPAETPLPPSPPEESSPEATPLPTLIPTPYLLPVTGVADDDAGPGEAAVLILTGLMMACLGGGVWIRRQQRRAER
jgi:hypothetical protein